MIFYTSNYKRLSLVFCLLLISLITFAQKNEGKYRIGVTVTDKNTHESIIMATLKLEPLQATSVTDADGKASLDKVPDGIYTLLVSYVGYEESKTIVKVNKDMNLHIRLTPTSLALQEVVVTAQQKSSGASTTSVVNRQAIDHLQAASLADIMQLLPGQKMGNTDLTSQTNLQLRTLTNNNTSAFGSQIVIDGVPISNNGALTQGQFSSSAFVGTDLRQVAADNIDQVEIIRGIPSAEYGDLTSGLVVVHSKVGVTPWQFKTKINPEMTNVSLGKGFNLNKAGIFNFNADYAKAWGDPRQKTRSFSRYNIHLGYGYDINRDWHTDTKFRFMYAKDWTGNDPDAIDDGTYSKNKNVNIGFTHNGRINVNKLLMRSLSYTFGVSMGWNDNINASYVTNSTGLLPIITATTSGYYSVPWVTTSYLAQGNTESRPGNIYAKINDSFYLTWGKTRQTFKVGIDYHYDWNNGKGYYNSNDSFPYRPNSNGRPRAFSDIPGLHQFSAYAEDNFNWDINRVNKLKINFGLRLTSLQPFSDLATTALSPRLNIAFSATKWLDIRAGIGMNSKTPGLNYLYPDKKYDDRVSLNYMPQNDPSSQQLIYHTEVYDVQRSKDLKNATTTKVEAGVDVKLPWGGRISVLAYQDRTPNGFGNATEYYTYSYNLYTYGSDEPTRTFLAYMTTGKIGNTNSTVNKGIEFDMDFGEIKPIHTRFAFSGAWSQTKTWSTDAVIESVKSSLLTAEQQTYNLTPFKVVYPSGLDFSKYRQFVNTLRIITNIPTLKMVASFTGQVYWHNWNQSYIADKDPIGWIDSNLQYHEITSDMTQIEGINISDLSKTYTDSNPVSNPITWNLSARLTKELGKIGGFSLYVNNCLYHEPYLKSSTTTTLTQRNTGTFSFGAELYFNL